MMDIGWPRTQNDHNLGDGNVWVIRMVDFR